MTTPPVPIEVPATLHEGDGETTGFALGFKAPTPAHLVVAIDGVLQTFGSDFTVEDGMVVFIVAPVAGARITFRRATPIEQAKEFPNAPSMVPRIIEEGFNLRARVEQELAERAERVLTVPVGEPGYTLPIRKDRREMIPVFNHEGDLILSPAVDVLNEVGLTFIDDGAWGASTDPLTYDDGAFA